MGENSTLNIIIFIALSGLVGFSLVFYLKYLITQSNKDLIGGLIEAFNKVNQINVDRFDSFVDDLNTNFNNHILEIQKFTSHLKTETDNYSETVSKYRNSINQINEKSVQLIELNKQFSKELREYSFKDLQQVTSTLRNTQESFNKIESSFNKHSESVKEMLSGFSNFQKNLQNSELNVQAILNLNANVEQVTKNFKETLVQIQIVSNSISALSEGKMKLLLEEITSVLPEIRKEVTKYSSDIYGKFSDSLDTLTTVSTNLNSITKKFDEISSGNKKDPATDTFLQ